MANNYLQFSFDFIVPEQARPWLNEVIRAMDEAPYDDCEPEQAKLLEDVFECSLKRDYHNIDPPDFEIDFDDENGVCWIHAEEYGNVDQVAHLLAALLKQCQGTELDRVGFTYSEACSAPRCNEFGGGWRVVQCYKGGIIHHGDTAYHQMQAKMNW